MSASVGDREIVGRPEFLGQQGHGLHEAREVLGRQACGADLPLRGLEAQLHASVDHAPEDLSVVRHPTSVRGSHG